VLSSRCHEGSLTPCAAAACPQYLCPCRHTRETRTACLVARAAKQKKKHVVARSRRGSCINGIGLHVFGVFVMLVQPHRRVSAVCSLQSGALPYPQPEMYRLFSATSTSCCLSALVLLFSSRYGIVEEQALQSSASCPLCSAKPPRTGKSMSSCLVC
jgi:hypothetical protein